MRIKYIILFLLFLVTSPVFAVFEITCDEVSENDPPELLDAKYKKCQEEIAANALIIKQKETESANLKRDLSLITSKVNKAKLEIKARNINILNLEKEIDRRSQKISDLSDKMDRMRTSISEIIRKTDDLESVTLPEIVFDNRNLSDFFSDLGSFDSIQESLNFAFDEIKKIKAETENQKKELGDKNEKERYLKSLQEIERKKSENAEKEKNKILKVTKGEEIKYKAMLAEKQTLVNKIMNMILKIGGTDTELKFSDALRLVRVAEQAIGVRAAFILAVLTQESGMNGVIGANQGKCYYNTSWKNGSGTVMSNTQKPSYLFLLAQLSKDPNSTQVSCPIKKDGEYGGAMGPSQIMPTTWWDINSGTGYKKRVEKVTGNVPASPFNNLDAFTGTALYLSDAMEGCERIYRSQYSIESCAAAKYYAGGKWKGYMGGYGAKVANRAIEFQKDIDVLDSQ